MSIDAQDHDDAETLDDQDEESKNRIQAWAADWIRNPQKAYAVLGVFMGGVLLTTTLFPLYWLFAVAMAPPGQTNIPLIPTEIDLYAFVDIFQQVPFARFMFNSLFYATTVTVVVILVASLAGYAFGRLDFRGKLPLLFSLLVLSWFPPATLFLPLFRAFNQQVKMLGLFMLPAEVYGTPGAVIAPLSAFTMPLAVFILMTFYAQIPDGLEDAARVEGSTRIGALFRVIMPLSAPGVATAGILTFITVYTEFFFSFLMTGDAASEWAPIVNGVLAFQSRYTVRYDLQAAASLVAIVPVAILVVLAQDKIVSGLTQGALKE
ncbi:carbohydrate ABC transporter permease [Halorhabdus sp. CBA1104]|uniref:carbohydrate ABC transporter permease n=1 Tax=Halorhabdus sp. CBA1104 TaxID=1380432 RepID=UPI0012B2997E|nr:carbohydrate ABC transporter permease [Halorhabdus sp. CBA1104]QGN07621.1 carbohydrate ABC transporter permease [Halorhabdus sp. CBA1104]